MPLITALISAIGLIVGSSIGAICSWFVTKSSINQEIKLQQENLNYQEKYKLKEKVINANIIRLDFCNAIYQSIRYLQKEDNYSFYNCIPIYKEYHKIVASLCGEYSLKELSYIYQLYGILEECSKMVEFYWRNGSVDIITVRNAYKNVLEKIYGSNYLKVLSKNIDYIGYKDL